MIENWLANGHLLLSKCEQERKKKEKIENNAIIGVPSFFANPSFQEHSLVSMLLFFLAPPVAHSYNSALL